MWNVPPYEGGQFGVPNRKMSDGSFYNMAERTPRHLLPPPRGQPLHMFGPRGAFIPPKFIPYQGSTTNRFNETGFWCDTCDKCFRSRNTLKQHKSEHQQCSIDGCQFVAHPNIITKHIQMQHSSGLFKKISKLSTPEEISKWIAERKKKYPTKHNIEVKNAMATEKFKRGEKLSMQEQNSQKRSFGKSHAFHKNRKYGNSKNSEAQGENNNSNGSRHTYNRKYNYRRKKVETKRRKKAYIGDDTEKLEAKHQFENLPRFKGTYEISKLDIELECLDVQNSIDEGKIDDDDWEIPHGDNNVNNAPTFCGALANLISSYGSDEDNSDPGTSKILNNHNKGDNHIATEVQHKTVKNEKNFNLVIQNDSCKDVDDESAPTEVKIERSETVLFPENDEKSTANKSPKVKKLNNSTSNKLSGDRLNTTIRKHFLRSRLPSTLLEKLLQKDIIHERNIILQCVHFIRNKMYFDV